MYGYKIFKLDYYVGNVNKKHAYDIIKNTKNNAYGCTGSLLRVLLLTFYAVGE